MYYGARYYDPALSRFITPDTIYDRGPQGLNRYTYALNNPIRYNDPSGHLSFSPDDDPDIWTKTDGDSGTSSSDGLLTLSEDSSQTQVYLGDGLYYDPSEALPEEAETTTDVLKEYGMTPNRLSRKASEISSIYGPIERSDAETVKMQIEMLRGNYRQAFRHWKNSWKAAAAEPGTYIEFAASMGTFSQLMKKSPKKLWNPTKNKTSVENAYGHWKKHGHEFSQYNNAKQYVEGAHNFIENPPKGTLTKTRATTGEKVFYEPSTNTFAVSKSNGTPKTMFKPDPTQHNYSTNLEYFYAQ